MDRLRTVKREVTSRYRCHTGCAVADLSWWRRVPFRSPRAERSGVPRASSVTLQSEFTRLMFRHDLAPPSGGRNLSQKCCGSSWIGPGVRTDCITSTHRIPAAAVSRGTRRDRAFCPSTIESSAAIFDPPGNQRHAHPDPPASSPTRRSSYTYRRSAVHHIAPKVPDLQELPLGRVLQRNIVLKGRSTGKLSVNAESSIAIDHARNSRRASGSTTTVRSGRPWRPAARRPSGEAPTVW